MWVFPKIVGTPKSSILIGFSIINHPFWGSSIFGNTHVDFIFDLSVAPTGTFGMEHRTKGRQICAGSLGLNLFRQRFRVYRRSHNGVLFFMGNMCTFWYYLHPRKLTCPLKRDYFNRKCIFQPSFFRGYVSFQGGYYILYLYHVYKVFHVSPALIKLQGCSTLRKGST